MTDSSKQICTYIEFCQQIMKQIMKKKTCSLITVHLNLFLETISIQSHEYHIKYANLYVFIQEKGDIYSFEVGFLSKSDDIILKPANVSCYHAEK